MTSTRSPCRASAAARLTVVVVLPTPPFWLATVRTARSAGRAGGRSPAWPARARCTGGRRAAVGDRGVLVVAPRSAAVDVSRETSALGHAVTTDRSSGRPLRRPTPTDPVLRHRATTRVEPVACDRCVRRSTTSDHSRTRPPTARRAAPVAAAATLARRRGRPFSASSAPPARQQRQRPAQQPVQRRDRPGGHHVEPTRRPASVLGPGPDDLDVGQPEGRRRPRRGTSSGAAAARPGRPSGRAGRARARCPGRPAPRPDVGHPRAAGMSGAEHGAVEQVPVPEPGHLARADQAALDARRSRAARRTRSASGQRVAEQRAPAARRHRRTADGACFT